jgi:predicted GIY-YIG superfamily endonuclease
MAYSRFLDIRNDKQEDTTNYPSSNTLRFGKEVEDDYRNNSSQRENIMKQLHKSNEKHLIKKRKQSVEKFETKKSYHFSNQPNLLKMNNPYSNLSALPLEICLSVNMSNNLRGETIPMACSCLL